MGCCQFAVAAQTAVISLGCVLGHTSTQFILLSSCVHCVAYSQLKLLKKKESKFTLEDEETKGKLSPVHNSGTFLKHLLFLVVHFTITHCSPLIVF